MDLKIGNDLQGVELKIISGKLEKNPDAGELFARLLWPNVPRKWG